MTDSSFSERNKSIYKEIAKTYNSYISFYEVTDDAVKDFPFGREDQPVHVSIATYYRLLITEILPDSIDRIIYLDGDIAVAGPLEDFYNTDIEGYPVAAVHDMSEVIQLRDKRLGYPIEEGYFNAGSILINLKFWRENNVYRDFLDVLLNHSQMIVFHDQDVMNYVFHGKIKWVDYRFNLQSGYFFKSYESKRNSDIIKAMKNPVVIHYCANPKPWQKTFMHPYKDIWLKYKAVSQWKDEKLSTITRCTPKELLRRALISLGIWHGRYITKRQVKRL